MLNKMKCSKTVKKLLLVFLNIFFIINVWAIGEDDFAKGMQFKKAGNNNEAYTYLSLAYKANPTSFLFKTELADVQYLRHVTGEALNLYKELVEEDTDNMTFKFRLTKLYFESKKYKQAIDLGATINIKSIPDENKFEFNYIMGQTYDAVKLFPKAIEYYLKAAQDYKGSIDMNYKIGSAYAGINNYTNAIVYFEKSKLMTSTNPNSIYEMSTIYYNAQNFPKAIEYAQKALAAGYEPSLSYYYELANVYYDLKDFKNCNENLLKAKEFSPYDQDVASLLAYSYYNQGALKEAREVLDEMLKLNPTNADLIYLYGLTYQKGNDMNRAEKYFDRAFKINPSLERLRVSRMKF
jgi:tetratricopeptide (TPR) repeat protein